MADFAGRPAFQVAQCGFISSADALAEDLQVCPVTNSVYRPNARKLFIFLSILILLGWLVPSFLAWSDTGIDWRWGSNKP